MAGACCAGSPVSRRLAWRCSSAAASILSAAILFVLPKCPLCLALSLTLVTGVGVSAANAARLRGMLVVLWLAALALTLVSVYRRYASGLRD